MKGRPVATLIALLVIASAGLLTGNAILSVRNQIAVGEYCDAARTQPSDAVLSRGQRLLTLDSEGLMAAECRCDALSALGRPGECARFFDDLLTRAGLRAWRPEPRLASRVARLRTWRAGRLHGSVETGVALFDARTNRIHPNATVRVADRDFATHRYDSTFRRRIRNL